MANYDQYGRDYPRRYTREEQPDRRYLDSRDYGKGYSSRDLIPRAREDSDLSVEEIRRDFPPPSGRDVRRARSTGAGYYEEYEHHRSRDGRQEYERRSRHHNPSGSVHHEEHSRQKNKTMSNQEKLLAAAVGAALLAGGKELYDRREAKEDHRDVHRNPLSTAALAGAGALAAYQGIEFYNKQQKKKDMKANYILHRGRDGQTEEYYSDDDEDSQQRKGHKNFLESALAVTGLGAAVKTLTGGSDDKRSDRGGSRSSSKARGGGGGNKIQKAAMASLLAGATEAFRVAKEPGSWKGEKAKRILTAAAGAATVDAVHGDKHGTVGLAESVIGGLVGTRLINGSRKDIEEDSVTGRSRSRSRARSGSRGRATTGLAALATAGLGALGAKKVLDHSRSQSRGRSRSSSGDRGGGRARSRSIADKARNGLAKLGIGAGAGAAAEDSRDRGGGRSRRYSDEYSDDDDNYGRSRGFDDDRNQRSGGGQRDRSRSGRDKSRSGGESDSDLGDSDEDEKRAKKLRGKQLMTGGLATIATIHAAHQVYSSMEKRKARQKAVHEGKLSPEEAKKLKSKAILQDAASVGIAAIGIKSAVEEMKEVKNLREEHHEWLEEKDRRHKKREDRRRRKSSSQPGSNNGDGQRQDSWAPPPTAGRLDRYDGYESEDDYGPRYRDDNPYGVDALPRPPIGRRDR